MNESEKSQIIRDAYENEKYADKMKSLKYIEKNDSEFGPVGADGLSLFRPHNLKPIAEQMNSGKEFHIAKEEDILFGFKWRGDQHIGYILEQFSREEPVILKSGQTSKNKTSIQIYYVVASYNFYTGNIDVNILTDSDRDSMERIAEIPNTETFYYDYLLFAADEDRQRRSQQMTITVGLWEDMQKQIQKLESRLDDLEKDLSENYSRRHNSLED